MQGTVVAVIVW